MPSISDLTIMLDNGLDVYKHYIPGEFRVNRKMISPLRPERDPSFNVFINRNNGQYWFTDHGIGITGNHWDFVMEKFGLNFGQAVNKVKEEVLNGGSTAKLAVPSYHKDYVVPVKPIVHTEIIPQFRAFDDSDILFFSKALISQNTLEAFNASPASSCKVVKTEGISSRSYTIGENSSSKMYIFPAISGRIKVYRPFEDKTRKWLSNMKAEYDFFGVHLLPAAARDCFLLAGNRDTMSFHENIGLPCSALASESSNLTAEFLHQLKASFRNVWVLYDNDKQGWKKAQAFEKDFGLPSLNHLFKKHGVDDFCDMTENKRDRLADFKHDLFSYIGI